MNVVMFASACWPLTTTWSMLGDHRILLGRRDPLVGLVPRVLVVVHVAVTGGAAGDAAQRCQVACLHRDVEALDGLPHLVFLRGLQRFCRGSAAPCPGSRSRPTPRRSRRSPAPSPSCIASTVAQLHASPRRDRLWRSGFRGSLVLRGRCGAAAVGQAGPVGWRRLPSRGSGGVAMIAVSLASKPGAGEPPLALLSLALCLAVQPRGSDGSPRSRSRGRAAPAAGPR